MKTPLRLVRAVAALVVTLTIALTSREARAIGPVDIEAGAKVGYGTSPGGGSVNPLGFGLGGRAGVSIFGIYAGGNIMTYFGSGDGVGGTYKASLQYGAEVGYGFKIAILTIRPQIGLGNITLSDGNVSASSFYLEPGAVVLISLGLIYIGADANALVITSEPAYGSPGSANLNTSTSTGFTFHGQVGISF